MRTASGLLATAVILCGSIASAQDLQQATWGRRSCPPVCPPSPYAPQAPPSTTPPATPQTPSEQALAESFAQAGEGGTMPPASFMPAMFGDFVGFSSSRLIFTQTEHVVRISTPTSGGASGFKIAENESPRPVDRIY